MTVKEYLDSDDRSGRAEFHDGEIFVIDDVSKHHSLISGNLTFCLVGRLVESPCKTHVNPRVWATRQEYCHPDIVVVCGKYVTTPDGRSLTNPKVIVEVLSPSTGDYDQAGKFHLYRNLPSFEEYMLVAQDRPSVEVRRKTPRGTWESWYHDSLDGEAGLESLGVSIPMRLIYAGVEIEPAKPDEEPVN